MTSRDSYPLRPDRVVGSPEHTAGKSAIVTLQEIDQRFTGIGNHAVIHDTPRAAVESQGGVFASDIVHSQSRDYTVGALLELDGTPAQDVSLVGIAIEEILPDQQLGTVLSQDVLIVPFPERVPLNSDTTGVLQVDIGLHITQHVVADDKGSHLSVVLFGGPQHADVGSSIEVMGVLQGTPRDGSFADRTPSTVQQDIRSERAIADISLDIAAGDLQVTDLAVAGDDSALAVVADVVVADVDLVQVDRVHKDTNAAVVIKVALTDLHIPIPVRQSDRVDHPANRQSTESGL